MLIFLHFLYFSYFILFGINHLPNFEYCQKQLKTVTILPKFFMLIPLNFPADNTGNLYTTLAVILVFSYVHSYCTICHGTYIFGKRTSKWSKWREYAHWVLVNSLFSQFISHIFHFSIYAIATTPIALEAWHFTQRCI